MLTDRFLVQASSDQNALDSQLMFTLTGVMISAIQIIGIVAVMSQVTFLVLAVLVPVSVACLWLQVSKRFFTD